MPQAQTPMEAFRECNPDVALQPDDPRYVDLGELRGTSAGLIEHFSFRIQAENGVEYVKALVTGHRGCGKTSELLRLRRELEGAGFFVLYFDVEDALGLADVAAVDILLTIAERIATALSEAGAELPTSLLDDLREYFETRTRIDVQQRLSSIGIKGEASIGLPGLVKLLAQLNADVKGVSDRRLETRTNLSLDFSAFASRLNRMLRETTLEAATRFGSQGLVVIVDGLEKLNYVVRDGVSNFDEIFVHNVARLVAPECHIIYTVPIALAYNQNLGNGFSDGVFVMPMLNMAKTDALGMLREVVRRRIDLDAVFARSEDVDGLIHTSGGCIRDLLRLVRSACGPGAKIGSEQVRRAVLTLQQEYDMMYTESDLPLLREVQEARTIDGVGEGGVLLHKRVVLEYRNDVRWVALHPAVADSPSFAIRLDRLRARHPEPS